MALPTLWKYIAISQKVAHLQPGVPNHRDALHKRKQREKRWEKTEGKSLRQSERDVAVKDDKGWMDAKLKDEEKEQRNEDVKGSSFHVFCN